MIVAHACWWQRGEGCLMSGLQSDAAREIEYVGEAVAYPNNIADCQLLLCLLHANPGCGGSTPLSSSWGTCRTHRALNYRLLKKLMTTRL
jgi:hypothetical protein